MDKDRSAPREEPESDDEARKGPAESRGLMGGPMVSVREGPGGASQPIFLSTSWASSSPRRRMKP